MNTKTFFLPMICYCANTFKIKQPESARAGAGVLGEGGCDGGSLAVRCVVLGSSPNTKK
jgi:hypothetical protein